MKKSNWGRILLILSTMIWGCGLVAQKSGMDYLGPFWFTAIRCTLGGLSLLPLVYFAGKRRTKAAGFDAGCEGVAGEGSLPDKKEKADRKTTVKASLICGLALSALIFFQQVGISYTSVGKAGFITALYIIITPLLERLLGKRISKYIWISVVIALAGLSMLTLSSGIEKLTIGDFLMLCGAFANSVQILAIDKWVQKVDSVKLSCYQFLVVGAVNLPLALIFETFSWEAVIAGAVPIIYAGIFSCGIGYTLQAVGQQYTPPSQTSLLLSLETVFTLLAGMLFLNEVMTATEYAGCAVMFAAIILSQKQPDKLK